MLFPLSRNEKRPSSSFACTQSPKEPKHVDLSLITLRTKAQLKAEATKVLIEYRNNRDKFDPKLLPKDCGRFILEAEKAIDETPGNDMLSLLIIRLETEFKSISDSVDPKLSQIEQIESIKKSFYNDHPNYVDNKRRLSDLVIENKTNCESTTKYFTALFSSQSFHLDGFVLAIETFGGIDTHDMPVLFNPKTSEVYSLADKGGDTSLKRRYIFTTRSLSFFS